MLILLSEYQNSNEYPIFVAALKNEYQISIAERMQLPPNEAMTRINIL